MRLFKFIALPVVLALLVTIQLRAATLTGQVIDAVTGNPIADANIAVDGGTSGAATGLDGRFTIQGVEQEREYLLTVTHLNYLSSGINCQAGSVLKIELVPERIVRKEVTVSVSGISNNDIAGTKSYLNSQTVSQTNTVAEPPFLATRIPNATFFNWGGHTLGATHLRIRGFDSNRLTVSVNGIPINDPEDHSVYWQDTPDFLSNTHDVEVQRGVSALSTAPAGIGGAMNLSTSDAVATRQTEFGLYWGDYNTRRRTFLYRSGLVDEKYNFTGRFSRATTDGYRDHSRVDEWSYFLAATRYYPDVVTTFETFGGREVSDLSYYALPKSILDTNRTWTPEAHHELDALGGWDGERDDFSQPHNILRSSWRITPELQLDEAIFWIQGDGFYEQYKNNRKFAEYGLTPFYRLFDNNGALDSTLVNRTDLIRRKFVSKDQIGWLPKFTWKVSDITEAFASLELRRYKSNHTNTVMWAKELLQDVPPQNAYNKWNMTKNYFGLSTDVSHKLNEKLKVNGGIEIRQIDQEVDQNRMGIFQGYSFTNSYLFLNPRFGANYAMSSQTSFYASLAMSGREPYEAQVLDPDNPLDVPKTPNFNMPEVKAERMTDLEIGGRHQIGDLDLGANVYGMFFNNEIVNTGRWIDSTETLELANAPTSTHLGLEVDGIWQSPLKGLSLSADVSLDHSTFGDFTFHYVDSIDGDWNYIDETVSAKGNQIPLTPMYVLNLRANYEWEKLTGELAFHSVSKQYLDARGDDKWSLDPYSLLNASVGYAFRYEGWGYRLSLNVMNLLDQEYEPYGWTETVDPYSVNPAGPPTGGAYQPMFIPAMGRMVLGGLTIEM